MAAMTIAVAELPDDVDALKAMIVAMAEQRALLEARTSHLEVVNKTADERIATLTAIVRMLERSRYGTRSERLRGPTLNDEQHAFVFDESRPAWRRSKPSSKASLRTSRNVRRVPEKVSRLIWSGLRLSSNLRFPQAVSGWRRF
jgi:hypothetical protein